MASIQKKSNNGEESESKYCFCRQPDDGLPMIECDSCSEWFHAKCVKLTHSAAKRIERLKLTWFCADCLQKSQPGTQELTLPNQSRPEDSDRIKCPFCPQDSKKTYQFPQGIRRHCSSAHKNDNIDNYLRSQELDNEIDFTTQISNLKQNTRILKRIPKGARSLIAHQYSSLVDQCVVENTASVWKQLLLFPYKVLRVPEKVKGKSLVQAVKENCSSYKNQNTQVTGNHTSKKAKPNKPSSLARRVEAKIADFDIRGALRLITSTDSIATPTDETLQALRFKHPLPSRELSFPSPPDDSTTFLQVETTDVYKAIQSFPNGSSGGIDGLRPQHLKDIVSYSSGEAGQKALKSLTKLCNFLLRGELNSEICPFFFGASLIALKKKDGGIRPIAVGCTYRRLVAKIACFHVKEKMSAYFLPRQLGFGTQKGCEAAVHATRTFVMHPENTNKIALKIDFENAFNSVERDTILTRVLEHVPELYNLMWQSYSSPSNLFFGNDLISSEVGCQQGDPAGPLAFSLAIDPIVKSLKAELNVWFLDDGTICDSPTIVLEDFKQIIQKASSIGLRVNPTKCELFFCNGQPDNQILQQFQNIAPGIRVVDSFNLELLGSPLLEDAMENFLTKKLDKIFLLVDRVKDLQAHYAYFLLKNCLLIPKMNYLLRTAPFWKLPSIVQLVDDKIKMSLEDILNIRLNDLQWTQASLPVNRGGLGIRKVNDLCLPAFLASSFGVKGIVSTLTKIQDYETDLPFLAEALNIWKSANNNLVTPLPQFQYNWDQLSLNRTVINMEFPSVIEEFRFKSLQNKVSGAWLTAIPSPNVGTFLNSDILRICIGLRLGADICQPHFCECGTAVDCFGRHGLSCKKNLGRTSRHTEMNKILQQSLASINVSSRLEPNGLFRDDGKRPDGMSNIPWARGRALVWDATCVDTLAKSNIQNGLIDPGHAAEAAAQKKHKKYSSIKDNHHFVAFAVETFGPWSAEAMELVNTIGSHLNQVTGDNRSRLYLIQRISLAIQRGNALSVLGTLPISSQLDEIYNL